MCRSPWQNTLPSGSRFIKPNVGTASVSSPITPLPWAVSSPDMDAVTSGSQAATHRACRSGLTLHGSGAATTSSPIRSTARRPAPVSTALCKRRAPTSSNPMPTYAAYLPRCRPRRASRTSRHRCPGISCARNSMGVRDGPLTNVVQRIHARPVVWLVLQQRTQSQSCAAKCGSLDRWPP